MKIFGVVVMLVSVVLAIVLAVSHDFKNNESDPTPVLRETQIAQIDQPLVGPSKAVVTKDDTSRIEDEVWDELMDETTLFIPSLEVYAKINNSDGNGSIRGDDTMLLPREKDVTQWDNGGTVADNDKPIVIVGNVDWNKKDSSLRDLEKTALGSVAFISDDEGLRQQYQLESLIPQRDENSEIVLENLGRKNAALVVVAVGGEAKKTMNGWIFEDSIISTWKKIGEIEDKHSP